MQAAARRGADAESNGGMAIALALANTAAVCGQCHAAAGSGPSFPEADDADAELGLSDTLGDRMERHAWAANRMWEGLIAPSDSAWRAGSAELASVPQRAP